MSSCRAVACGVVGTLLVAGCSGGTHETGSTTTGSTGYVATRSASPTGADSSPTAPATALAPSPSPPPAPRTGPTADPASIQSLIDATYDGHGLKLGREGGSTSAYRQYFVTYEGDGLTISGRINIPRGRGPFPAVVLAHGYVPIEQYTNGETMLRERDYLARHGYVTLHIDYRNHAQSDKDPHNDANLRTGYTEDAINAGRALQQLPYVDASRLAIVGRSMGGGVVYNAIIARPDLFKAAVAYSPVSSDTVDNVNRWVRHDSARSGAARQILARLGTPEDHPQAWAATSPRTYFDRIRTPLLIHHGTADEDCPIAWSRKTVTVLRAEGKDVTFDVYQGERHTFTTQWPLSIRRTVAFLDKHLH